MKDKLTFGSLPRFALFLALTPAALGSTTWYVNGVNGNDKNHCLSPASACKTIGHAISLALSGDTVKVAAATYKENLNITRSLRIVGSNALTTIIDGSSANSVVRILNAVVHVGLANLTIRNGMGLFGSGGGVLNAGILTIADSTISGNSGFEGGGVYNAGTLIVFDTTISGNDGGGYGGGIYNTGTLTIFDATISGNHGGAAFTPAPLEGGGGIVNEGTLTLVNSTIEGNYATVFYGIRLPRVGGGIKNSGKLTIRNTTFAGNVTGTFVPMRPPFPQNPLLPGRGWDIYTTGQVTIENSIVGSAGYFGYSDEDDCYGPMTSNGYNLSRDNTCNFNNIGDQYSTDPKLGTLGYYGGPTQTIPLLSGSPAIDAGNPSGCRDSQGNLLKTDQRGYPRPDSDDKTTAKPRCDMGAYESQSLK